MATSRLNVNSVDLTRKEATYLTLDRAKFAGVVGEIFEREGESATPSKGAAMVVGTHGVAAGIGIPIVLMIPGPMEVVSEDTLTALGAGSGPFAIAIPNRGSISKAMTASLTGQGHAILALSEITEVKDHRLVGTRRADELLSGLRQRQLSRQAPAVSGRAWLLPADARWEELAFEFTGPESLNIRFRGDTRMFDPQLLGMKRKRTGMPTSQWAALQSLRRERRRNVLV